MNDDIVDEAREDSDILKHVSDACARVAPTWPLDQFIAVNPWWNLVQQPFASAMSSLRRSGDIRTHMPREILRELHRSGALQDAHLRAVCVGDASAPGVDTLKAAINGAPPVGNRLPLVTDIADAARDLGHAMAWRDYVTHHISQQCAAWFDNAQAAWHAPHAANLYAHWRQYMLVDRSPRLLMGHRSCADRARALPADALASIAMATRALDVPAGLRAEYYSALLLSINGWAAWCAYTHWQARLDGADAATLHDSRLDLLAIRLAWEFLLFDETLSARLQAGWHGWMQPDAAAATAALIDDCLLQASELAYQAPLIEGLLNAPPENAEHHAPPSVQAVFCIDVRSEVYRRALESVDSEVETRGFAGFFGLPIDYAPLGGAMVRPQLPGLLAPALRTTDTLGDAAGDVIFRATRQASLAWRERWRAFRHSAVSTFSCVETTGLAYAPDLLARSLPRRAPSVPMAQQDLSLAQRTHLRPTLAALTQDASPEQLVALAGVAASMLTAMGLTSAIAPTVLLVGHGSQSANNAHAAGLDCGACGGQTGEVNARVAAGLLNDPRIRGLLPGRGIELPAQTRFIAALHNTTTDEVTLFDTGLASDAAHTDLTTLTDLLARAGERARAERAPSLGLGKLAGRPQALRRAIHARANDWSEVRPEWGLANNAAFIVAPRTRSRHLDLHGRCFLHDYRWQDDPTATTLELIMTAPMIVTHWINLQYFASTVDNARFGSGNKVLHNVVGGRLGVFEGNGGDLRIGLPMQSLHDGTSWQHTPLRLSVFIESPEQPIASVLHKHAQVRTLLDHEWLHLFRIDGITNTVTRYRGGAWVSADALATS